MSKLTQPHKIVDARDSNAKPTIQNGAIEGHVLVKNTKNTLPLEKPRLLSLFGYSAKSPDLFAPANGVLGAAWTIGAEPVSIDDVFSGALGKDHNFSAIAINGTMLHGGGSGATTPASFISPLEALKWKAHQEGTALFHDFRSSDPAVDASSDACIVFGNAWAAEGYDRPSLRDDYTDGLVKSVADQCNKTIVILHNAGPRLVDQFIDHPNVTGVIFAHLPGQETGPALVSLLYGESNTWGRLPYTVAKNESDYGDVLDPDLPEDEYEKFPQSTFEEGVYIDYKHFDRKGIEPRYEFGFGLTYTSFEHSNFSAGIAPGVNTAEFPTGAVISGGQADLWDVLATATVTVTNNGTASGAEVAQLYVGLPPKAQAPLRQLRGFEKCFLKVNESATVTFELTRRDLSRWDTGKQKWRLHEGEYDFWVGSSSRKLLLKDKVLVD